jgi:hypothetical protein
MTIALLVIFTGLISPAAPYVVFLDSSQDIQILDVATGQRRDTRQCVGGDYKLSPE